MKIIIYGTGTLSELLYYYITNDSNYEIIAFTVDNEFLREKEFCNLPVVSFENIEDIYCPNEHGMIIAIGYSYMRKRRLIYNRIKEKKYLLINYIHSSVNINNTLIGEGNIILKNTTIEPFVTIGDNNILWSSVNLSHNSKISSHCFFASQSLVGGFTKVKDNCFIGFRSTLIQNIIVEKETLVGACSLITKNTTAYGRYMGVPAIKVGSHKSLGIKIK